MKQNLIPQRAKYHGIFDQKFSVACLFYDNIQTPDFARAIDIQALSGGVVSVKLNNKRMVSLPQVKYPSGREESDELICK